jgi:hypothetical protein
MIMSIGNLPDGIVGTTGAKLLVEGVTLSPAYAAARDAVANIDFKAPEGPIIAGSASGKGNRGTGRG